MAAVMEYYELVSNLQGGRWQVWSDESIDTKLDAAMLMLRSMADAWYRLCFYYEDARFIALKLLLDAGGAIGVYDREAVCQARQQLDRMHATCPDCLCSFASNMLQIMRWRPRTAVDAAMYGAAAMRVGSATVERAHQPGQGLHATRARGLAPASRALSELTYRTSVVNECRGHGEYVRKKCLEKFGLTSLSYSALARGFRNGPRRQTELESPEVDPAKARRRANNEASRVLGGSSRRKCDAYRVFRKTNWMVKARLGTPEFKAEDARLKALWREQTDAEIAYYEAAAALHDGEERRVRETQNAATISGAVGGVLSHHTACRLKRDVFVSACRSMETHDVWKQGLGIMTLASGLAPEKVVGHPEISVFSECAKYFDYDPEITPNPPGGMAPRKSCHERFWGVCCADPLCGPVQALTYNMYFAIHDLEKLGRPDFPLLARLSLNDECAADVLICETVGRGDTVILIKLCAAAGEVRLLELETAGGRPIIATAQQVLRKLYSGANATVETNPTVEFSCFPRNPQVQGGKVCFDLNDAAMVRFMYNLPAAYKWQAVKARRAAAATAGSGLPFGLAGTAPDGPCFKGVDDDDAVVAGSAAAAKARGGSDSDSGVEALECDEAAPDDVVRLQAEENAGDAAGERLGIVGFDFAKSGRSRCVCCESRFKFSDRRILIGEGEFRYAHRAKRNKPERHLHERCLSHVFALDGHTAAHTRRSVQFLREAALAQPVFSELQHRLLSAVDVLRAREGEHGPNP